MILFKIVSLGLTNTFYSKDSPSVLNTGKVRRSYLVVVYFTNILLLSPKLI